MAELLQFSSLVAHVALCVVCVRASSLLQQLTMAIVNGAETLSSAADKAERAATKLERAANHG